jgi:hypothetical protein
MAPSREILPRSILYFVLGYLQKTSKAKGMGVFNTIEFKDFPIVFSYKASIANESSLVKKSLPDCINS